MSKNYIEWVTRSRWQCGSIFIGLTVVACKICEIIQKFKLLAVQGHPRSSVLVPMDSALCHLLLVINSNFGRISYLFDTFTPKIARFPYPTLVWRPLAKEHSAINVHV